MATENPPPTPLTQSKEARAQRLHQLRALTATHTQKQLSRAAIERKYGLSASTLRHWEEGYGIGLTEDGAKQAIDIYQQEHIACSFSWLMEGTGPPPQRVRAAQERPTPPKPSDLLNTRLNECEYFKTLHPEAVTLNVKDDTMSPFYKPDDVVGGIRHYRAFISDLIGKDCIVETKTGNTYLRRLQKSTVPGQYNLYSLNPNTKVERPHEYAIEVRMAAPVVRIWRGKKW